MQSSPQPASQFDSLRAQFRVMKECPLCEKSFGGENIQLVEQDKSSQVLHVTCPHCYNSLIILIGFSDIGVGIVGLSSDLNFEDARRFKQRGAIDEDNLLEYFLILHKQHQDILKLLDKK